MKKIKFVSFSFFLFAVLLIFVTLSVFVFGISKVQYCNSVLGLNMTDDVDLQFCDDLWLLLNSNITTFVVNNNETVNNISHNYITTIIHNYSTTLDDDDVEAIVDDYLDLRIDNLYDNFLPRSEFNLEKTNLKLDIKSQVTADLLSSNALDVTSTVTYEPTDELMKKFSDYALKSELDSLGIRLSGLDGGSSVSSVGGSGGGLSGNWIFVIVIVVIVGFMAYNRFGGKNKYGGVQNNFSQRVPVPPAYIVPPVPVDQESSNRL